MGEKEEFSNGNRVHHASQEQIENLHPQSYEKRHSSIGDSLKHLRGTDRQRFELKEADEYEHLGYCYPTWKKWFILTIMFLIQISINLNASLYANGVKHVATKFQLSEQAARVPQLTFLCAYAFGCELWAPWSEELGRWPTQQLSLLLVNIWQIPCALAPNYATLIICRLLGGLSTAGGSVTLGVVADMWEPDDQGTNVLAPYRSFPFPLTDFLYKSMRSRSSSCLRSEGLLLVLSQVVSSKSARHYPGSSGPNLSLAVLSRSCTSS